LSELAPDPDTNDGMREVATIEEPFCRMSNSQSSDYWVQWLKKIYHSPYPRSVSR
jgi:hypothetical protein